MRVKTSRLLAGVREGITRIGGNMKDLFRLTAPCAAAILFASLSHAGTISTYTFTGDCTDCTGQGTGTLVLQNYTLGTALQKSNFVSFSYTSNFLDIHFNSLTNIVGMLPVSLPGPANVGMVLVVPGCVTIKCSTDFFDSHVGNHDQWEIGEEDQGVNGVWSGAQSAGVPEPAPFGMLITGLAH